MGIHSRESLDYVQSLFPDAIVAEGEMISGDSSYDFAMRWDGCENNCPGTERCAIHGYAPRIYEETFRGNRVFVVRAGLCANRRYSIDQKRLAEMVKASRIPPELEKCSFENYEPMSASAFAAKKYAMYCAGCGEGLLLEGPPGVGKTHLAVAIVRHTLDSGRSALFVPFVNLLDEMKETLALGKIDALLEALREVGCLALDDLGIEKSTAWVTERLYGIVNDRYNSKKQIVVTTNARSIEDLAGMIGDGGQQIASRLGEMAVPYAIEAPDYRKKKGAEARRHAIGNAMAAGR